MKSGMIRNKRPFFYASYMGEEAVTDAYGDYTGDTNPTYGPPTQEVGNVSPASGQSVIEVFGSVSDYDRVIGPLPLSCPINEYSKIWLENGIKEPADYRVRRRAVSLSHVMLLVSKVETNK